jgi:hypothetical protein
MKPRAFRAGRYCEVTSPLCAANATRTSSFSRSGTLAHASVPFASSGREAGEVEDRVQLDSVRCHPCLAVLEVQKVTPPPALPRKRTASRAGSLGIVEQYAPGELDEIQFVEAP